MNSSMSVVEHAFLEHLRRKDPEHERMMMHDAAYRMWISGAATITAQAADSLERHGVSRSAIVAMVDDVSDAIARSNEYGRRLREQMAGEAPAQRGTP